MKTTSNSSVTLKAIGLAAVHLLLTQITLAQPSPGIPEPSLIWYGQVRNPVTGGIPLTHGTLRWMIQPPSGASITVTVALTNVNDQFSYVAHVPFETVLPGLTLSSNTLSLSPTPVNYTRSATINSQPATLIAPAAGNFTFGQGDRGHMERVDLEVSLPFIDSDGDEIDDNWETAYFGSLFRNPNEDPDGDGMNNFAEYKAGTNPNDPQSRFAFIGIGKDPAGGFAIRWSSEASRKYTLQRSSNLLTGFSTFATNIDATPGTNYFRDPTLVGTTPYFYRIKIE
jgi:hypothetical protein